MPGFRAGGLQKSIYRGEPGTDLDGISADVTYWLGERRLLIPALLPPRPAGGGAGGAGDAAPWPLRPAALRQGGAPSALLQPEVRVGPASPDGSTLLPRWAGGQGQPPAGRDSTSSEFHTDIEGHLMLI